MASFRRKTIAQNISEQHCFIELNKEFKKSNSRHGLSIGIERTGSSFSMTMKAIGKLTHEDYEAVTPVIDSTLAGEKKPKSKCCDDTLQWIGE